jgi:hypothetical protein
LPELCTVDQFRKWLAGEVCGQEQDEIWANLFAICSLYISLWQPLIEPDLAATPRSSSILAVLCRGPWSAILAPPGWVIEAAIFKPTFASFLP